jgi:hypothetical protein
MPFTNVRVLSYSRDLPIRQLLSLSLSPIEKYQVVQVDIRAGEYMQGVIHPKCQA